ncbi:MAG TPA: hypothetical protein VJY15_10210 [Candidatus Acidoferrum sp.]|nr:hypothetical protein [Candidatus Acidoferrum sp.]
MLNRLGRLILAIGLAALGYLLIYRPLQLHWGATKEEVHRAMPGDEIQPKPIFNAMRAITIQARPEAIWPWLVQMGYRRAGWYGYDWIDNDGIPSSMQILPQWQRLKVGDTIPIWRNIEFAVRTLEPNRTLVFAGGNGSNSNSNGNSMALGLYPIGANHTRLLWRIRLAPYAWNSPLIAAQVFTDLADFVAVRQNILGIKARAEGVPPEAPQIMYAGLALWLGAFLSFLAAEITLVFSKGLLKPFLVAAAIGLLTVWLVLVKPALWICAMGTLLTWTLLWWAVHAKKVVPSASHKLDAPA